MNIYIKAPDELHEFFQKRVYQNCQKLLTLEHFDDDL